MTEYNKIQTLWKREPQKPCNMIIGEYAKPEFELLKDIEWVATEKVDGTNIRIMWDNNKVRFGGKTDAAMLPAFLYDRLNEMFSGEIKEQIFEQTFDCGNVCLYGEGYGAKIQNGGNYRQDQSFVLFDVKVGDFWLDRNSIEDIADKLAIDVVPIVYTGTLNKISDFVKNGFNSRWGSFMAEGIVAKPKVELRNRKNERIITKLKHKDFLKLIGGAK